jgi:hypothetical protein
MKALDTSGAAGMHFHAPREEYADEPRERTNVDIDTFEATF